MGNSSQTFSQQHERSHQWHSQPQQERQQQTGHQQQQEYQQMQGRYPHQGNQQMKASNSKDDASNNNVALNIKDASKSRRVKNIIIRAARGSWDASNRRTPPRLPIGKLTNICQKDDKTVKKHQKGQHAAIGAAAAATFSSRT